MKKFLLFMMLAPAILTAQTQNPTAFLTDVNVSVYCPNFDRSKQLANEFIKEHAVQIVSLTERENILNADFYLSDGDFEKLDKLLPELGFVQERIITTNNYETRILEIEREIEYLNDKKTVYSKELEEMEEKDNRYYNYWNELRVMEKRLFELQKQLEGYQIDKQYRIKLNLYDDQVDMTDRTVNWVNMPGASFDILFTETPNSEITADMYMGYSLKYMITRGKTHFTLGVLKQYPKANADSALFKEYFHFGYGQDFYTKHFGRGKRTWFNLYTGYNLGGLFATAENRKTTLPYMKAFFGVEIFKNKYFLIDNKVGYFVPFKYNRNMRGLEYSFSFNFVF